MYNYSRRAYDLGEVQPDEDYYHTARRTPYMATKQGRDDLAQKYRLVGTDHVVPSKPKMRQIVNLRGDNAGWRPMAERVIRNETWVKREGERMRREAPKNGYFGF